MTVKQQLHHAIDAMSDDDAGAARRTLATTSGDPVAWMFAHTPLDDEPETDEERAAVAEADRELSENAETITIEQLKRELDIT